MKGAAARRRSPQCAVALVSLFAAGCGYTLVDYSDPPPGLATVAIVTFDNGSYEPGAELVVSDAMRREFLRRGALKMVRDPALADLVIRGDVDGVSARSRSFSSVAQVLEWELTLSLRVRAELRDGTRIPVDEEAMTETDRFLASADIEATRKNREETLRKLSAVLSRRVHDMLYEAHEL